LSANNSENEFSFKLKPWNRGVSDEELLADLQRVAKLLNRQSMKRNEYVAHGKYSYATFERRFDSWNVALLKAGLQTSGNRNVSDQELVENLERVWIALGRQPKRSELVPPQNEPPAVFQICDLNFL
jgi:hypothetical protein